MLQLDGPMDSPSLSSPLQSVPLPPSSAARSFTSDSFSEDEIMDDIYQTEIWVPNVDELSSEEYEAVCDSVTVAELLQFQAKLHAEEIAKFGHKVSPTYNVVDGQWIF